MDERPGLGGWIVTRRARPSDLGAVERIERSSFHRKVSYSRRRLLHLIRGVCFVSVAGGAVVGYVAVRAEGGRGYITSVAVQPSMRGLGIGRKMVRKALSLLRRAGFRSCSLHVSAAKSGVAAHRLYQRMGFAAVARRQKWYEDGSDAWYMTKELRS